MFYKEIPSLKHSHKKRKDSLKTRAERAVLRAYVENQANINTLNINKRKGRAIKTAIELPFFFPM